MLNKNVNNYYVVTLYLDARLKKGANLSPKLPVLLIILILLIRRRRKLIESTHTTLPVLNPYWGFEVVAGCSQTSSEDWKNPNLQYVRCSSSVLILCFGHSCVLTGGLKCVQLCGCLYTLKEWTILRALCQLLRRLSDDGTYIMCRNI